MDKLNYTKELTTATDEKVRVTTHANNRYIHIRLVDNDRDCALVTLTLKEAQRVKRYLEDAITTNIINWEEELWELEDMIKELISEYEQNTKPQYYLGMSDEDAAAEDARADVYSQVIQDLYSLI